MLILVINNGGAGQVRWVHENLHPGRADLYDVPFADLTALGTRAGIDARRIESAAALVDAWQAYRSDPRPMLCEVVVAREDHPDRAMRVRRQIPLGD